MNKEYLMSSRWIFSALFSFLLTIHFSFYPTATMRLSALFGVSAVALGAFGAHALKSRGISADSMDVWKTANLYHLTHSLAILALEVAALSNNNKLNHSKLQFSIKLFAIGVSIFSGSLYALVLTNVKKLGAITPIGGLIMIAAWGSLLYVEE